MAGENGWPDNWQVMPIEDCMSAIIDYRGKTPRKTTFGIPLVTAKIVKNGRIDTPNEFIDPQEYDTWMRRGLPEPGDVVMTTEAPLGETAQLDDTKVALAQRLITLRGQSKLLDNTFLKFLMQSDFVQEQLTARATGTTVLGIKQSELRKVSLVVPPLSEQKAIAEILGALDAKIELNRRMNETLESLARRLFKSWFLDFDPVRAKMDGREPPGLSPTTAALFPAAFEHQNGELVPAGWVKTTLGDEIDFQTGFAFKSKFFTEEPPGIRLARGMNVKEGEFFWNSQARYWPEVTPDIEEYLLQAGDVLIGMDGSKVGKNWVRVRAADLPCLLVQRVARLRAASSIGENFIWILVGSSTFRYYVEAVKTGTSIPHISGGQIKSYDFIRPPLDENRVFEHFESLVSPMTEQADKNHAESETLAALRDTLLPRLLSGELRVADAARTVEADT